MERLLTFFQITTVRSVKMFSVGSALLFLFGIYALTNILLTEKPNEQIAVVIVFYAVWFLITGSYIVLGVWTLVSEEGRKYLSESEVRPGGHRNLGWYFKFLFACYASAFGSLILVGIAALPFFGFGVLERIVDSGAGKYFLVFGLIWAPFIYKYLK